jgi:DNA-binding NarL/FixJ family response regulator
MSQHEATGRIRIALAHSQQLFLDAFAALLEAERNLDLVWSGTTPEGLLEALAKHKPDVAILDLEMPRIHGISLMRQAQDANTKAEFIITGERRGPALSQAVADAGARAFITTDLSGKLLIEALRAAADHRNFTGDTRGAAAAWTDKVTVEALSTREVEVLRLLSTGLSSRQIATKLSLSFRTVDGYRASLMDKLEIRTVPGLVKFAIRHRLADLRE